MESLRCDAAIVSVFFLSSIYYLFSLYSIFSYFSLEWSRCDQMPLLSLFFFLSSFHTEDDIIRKTSLSFLCLIRSLRPHTLVAEGLMHSQPQASYTSIIRKTIIFFFVSYTLRSLFSFFFFFMGRQMLAAGVSVFFSYLSSFFTSITGKIICVTI